MCISCFDRYHNRLQVRIQGWNISEPESQPSGSYNYFAFFLSCSRICLWSMSEIESMVMQRFNMKNKGSKWVWLRSNEIQLLSFDPGQDMFNFYNLKALFKILLVESVAIPGAVPTVKDDRVPVYIWSHSANPSHTSNTAPTTLCLIQAASLSIFINTQLYSTCD